MTDNDFLLAVLADGKPHSHAELLRRSIDERGHGFTPHSRAADLRKQGHDVQVTTWRANGRRHSSYRLVVCVEPQTPSSQRSPQGCGSTGSTADEGDGQLALIDAPARGAYSEAA